jgi:hypothetical protein
MDMASIEAKPMLEPPQLRDPWRRELGKRIAWTLAAKLLALTLLWLIFFRGSAL